VLTDWLTGCDWLTDWLTGCGWLTDWSRDVTGLLSGRDWLTERSRGVTGVPDGVPEAHADARQAVHGDGPRVRRHDAGRYYPSSLIHMSMSLKYE